jgi:hypothetical protein
VYSEKRASGQEMKVNTIEEGYINDVAGEEVVMKTWITQR